MINQAHSSLSIRQQCKLLSLERSSYYYAPRVTSGAELSNIIGEIYSKNPVFGYRKITELLKTAGHLVNHKKVLRLMRQMNIQAIYPKPNTSIKTSGVQTYPYLLANKDINKPNMVWQIDITYLRTQKGFMYLVALIDVYSRFVVGARIGNSLCADLCVSALEDAAYKYGCPDIVNSDQGSQFTSDIWLNALQKLGVQVSMTGKGRCCDNVYIERLWRSFKYEGSYLYDWRTVDTLKENVSKWLNWYNEERPHQSLKYKTPMEVYCGFVDKSCNLPTSPQLQQQLQQVVNF